MRDRMKERRREAIVFKQAVLIWLKTTSPCVDCQRFYPAVIMDFDHVRGKKRWGIAVAVGNPRVSVMNFVVEVEKCDLTCANCHRVRTYEDRRVFN